ncbi:hypothetical protein H0I76_17895 [Limibaculum sp. M0105]|uniref:Uncharacterized protein n=1 Tax=Thermohalobaculum xanthum TaxID=2753746 RepID=A0A8J7M9A7_9RHOB|nr:hypothetical protein [Thermohalobaculum xanthum]MBK0401074.1 hypothetical protein [Thermohalobaculum xanthum]
MRRCVLHIGSEKTGTTSIQAHFGRSREGYRAAGVLYPETGSLPGLFVHKGISQAIRGDRGEIDHRIFEALAAEVGAAPDCATTVISSEFFHSEFRLPGRIAAVREALGAIFDRIEIVLYVRRQDRMAVSMHSTALKGGWSAEKNPLSVRKGKGDYYFDFAAIADNWSAAFGREALRVRVYDRRSLLNGSIIDDFCAAAGVGRVEGGVDLALNVSPSWQALEVIRLFNTGSAGNDADLRQRLWRCLSDQEGDRTPLLPRAQAEEFLARFAASNERLAQEYLGLDAATPFDQDFSDYPEERPHLTPVEIVERLAACFPGREA